MTDALDFLFDDATDAGEPAEVEQLPDGVYLGLDPEIYFGQRQRLGGSDLITLDKKREGWWWKSEHNPLLKREDTDAQNYGSALHAILLEGLDAYHERFAIAPDPAEYPGVITSTDEIRAALQACGRWSPPTGVSKWKKANWVEEGLAYLDPDQVTIWDAVMDAFQEAAGTKAVVTAAEDHQLRFMRDMALNTDTPEGREVANLFNSAPGYPTLAEVSVLYTDPRTGVRRRARIDRMFPGYDLDLKSMRGHWAGKKLDLVADDVIRANGYDIQRADYHLARRMIYAFIVMGMENVHGGTEEQRAWLSAWPDRFPKWDWVWAFYQKPDMKAGDAPIIFPVLDAPRSDYHVKGLRKAVRALDLYVELVARHGLDSPWGRIEPLHYTDQDMPQRILLHPDNSSEAREPLEDEDQLLGG